MGPLGRLWKSVDQQLRSEVTEEEILALPDAAELLEQSILLIGQCLNALTYERRRNVLSSILSGGTSQISAMLKDNKDILKKNEDGMLFGKSSRSKLKRVPRTRRSPMKLLTTTPPHDVRQLDHDFDGPFEKAL